MDDKMNGIISIIAAVVAFIASYLLGFTLIPFLKRLKFGQTIREIGPSWHKSKEGTPTMGGIIIVLGLFISLIISFCISAVTRTDLIAEADNPMKMSFFFSGIGLALGMGFIGFIDDYIKVVKKQNLGLTAGQKTFMQFLVSSAYLLSLKIGGMSTTWIPFIGDVDLTRSWGLLFWPIALFFVYGFTNAVNLTDGIDGLATSVTVVVSCAFMLAAGFLGFAGFNTFAAAAAGACVGFLVWNSHPAKVFMGDTGSMFLGGMVVAMSFGIGRPILLIFAGIIYLAEALSVILQVTYYKKTKKRLFKMAPLHHHFEMSGWSENKIVLVFSVITMVGCFVALMPILFNW